jgi:hypothetical protein
MIPQNSTWKPENLACVRWRDACTISSSRWVQGPDGVCVGVCAPKWSLNRDLSWLGDNWIHGERFSLSFLKNWTILDSSYLGYLLHTGTLWVFDGNMTCIYIGKGHKRWTVRECKEEKQVGLPFCSLQVLACFDRLNQACSFLGCRCIFIQDVRMFIDGSICLP